MGVGVLVSSCFVVLQSATVGVLLGVCADLGVEVAVGLADFMGVLTVFSLLSVAPPDFFFALELVALGGAGTLEGVVICDVFFEGVVSVLGFALLDG